MVYEASVFRKRLAMTHWVATFVEAALPDYAEDCRRFLDLPDVWAYWKQNFTRKNWFGLSFEGVKWQREVQQRFRRLESVLVAKVLTSGAKTEMLAEQISICRMTRAIGTALYVIGIEFTFFSSAPGGSILSLHLQDQIILFIIGALILVCGPLITVGAYSRFANMLLSLVYVSWKRENATRS